MYKALTVLNDVLHFIRL